MAMLRWKKVFSYKYSKDILKIVTFIVLINLPYLTISQVIGMDNFLDSFHDPEEYRYVKSSILDIQDAAEGYLIIQKSSHQEFSVALGDNIFLIDEGGLACRSVYQISTDNMKRYYTISFSNEEYPEPIYEYQIIGKVVGVVEDNIWNSISLKLWDISINNLNIAALFTNN